LAGQVKSIRILTPASLLNASLLQTLYKFAAPSLSNFKIAKYVQAKSRNRQIPQLAG